MKKGAIILSLLVTALIFIMSGCSDFSFNPIGRWEAKEQRLYENDKITDTMKFNDNSARIPALVFKKSGTGYIDSGTKNTLGFTYEYNDNEVTITRSAAGNDPVTTVYQVRDNGTSLVVTLNEYDAEEASGKTTHVREEIVFMR